MGYDKSVIKNVQQLADYLKALREDGLSYKEITKETGLSKTTICQLLRNKKHAPSGREIIREKIRIRDNHTCQFCGNKWIEGTRRFDVHHKDCKKEKSRQCDNYEKEKDNMITLCHRCHLNLPEHKKEMSKKKLN